jgi:hypothetical protein
VKDKVKALEKAVQEASGSAEEWRAVEVYALLPLTRNADRAMAKVGFETLGVIDYDGIPFRQYRLGREQWELLQAE